MAAIGEDLKSGTLVRPTVDWPETFRAAVELATRHSPRLGCRSLDVLHAALALLIGTEQFVSLDGRQAALAREAGLHVAEIG